MLDIEKSFELLKGLSIARHILVLENSELEIIKDKISELGFPLWIKINTGEHKLSLGGVKKCGSYEELLLVFNEFKKKFIDSSFIIQEDVKGVEVILGIKTDKTFGKVLVFGAGGSYTELVKDIEFRVYPLDKGEIEDMIKQLKIYKILEKKKCNISKLVDLIYKFSQLSIIEADLNPVVVNEKDAVVVDARIEV